MEGFQSLKRSMAFHPNKEGSVSPITPSQWGVLMMIEEHGESAVKDVALALCITPSAATQLIDGLVESGYVAREAHPEDRRRVTLTLSKKTKSQVEKMKKQFIERFLTFFEALNDEEFDQFILLHKKIFNALTKK